ncbi:MAG: glutamine synthetase type III, partial [Oscillospiraceae bacterium]|nr:glutamine synthetase type III [Oscillospiraceae bacterium]
FCSYTGEILDKKTPLLRSMEIVNEQALRILRLFGNTRATRVTTTVGAEQEYFLIDKALYDKREDLVITGRTLFGAKPPKGQELEDHYFGNIKQRISNFMKELDEELWKLGVLSKTKHNEAAPAQHELAPIFSTSNIAADHNQLTMELMKKIALKHNLVCLLHEKPFAGVNGSGKHNNWSICSNDGQNLLDPGDTPTENMQFITFLCAIIKAVHENSDLLRLSAASAGNDHRLGANEAPPAIISIFIGEELEAILEALENNTTAQLNSEVKFEIGVDALPSFKKDTTDRNRTSPMAFTGNKFEFRMLGSADSISCTNVIMNTIVADALSKFADELENAKDFNSALKKLLVKTIKEHKCVIFNGNGYSDEWVEEAVAKRGLPNYISTVDCVPQYMAEKNVELFEKFKVYSRTEIASRTEILLDNYSKVINIEALTMIDMAKKQIYPAVMAYTKEVCDTLFSMKSVGIENNAQTKLANRLSVTANSLDDAISSLEQSLLNAKEIDNVFDLSKFYRNDVFAKMQVLRAVADELETIVAEKYWPFPVYADLLFKI